MSGQRRNGKRMTPDTKVQTTDLRTAQRAFIQIIARFSATDRFHHGNGMTLDLSEIGCKLSSTERLPVGSSWNLYLTVSETSRPVLISEVQVVWAVENECGIEFPEVTTRELTRLRQFIWKHLNRSTVAGGPPLFTLAEPPNLQGPYLKSVS